MSQDKNTGRASGWNDKEVDWLEELMSEKAPAAEEPPRPTETARRPALSDWEDVRSGRETPRETEAQGRIRASEYEPYRPGEAEADEPYYGGTRRRSASVPLIIVIVVLVMGMLFAGWQLGSIFLNYHRDRSAYNNLAQNAISGLAEAEDRTGAAIEQPADEADAAPAVSEVPIQVDWGYLRSVNKNVVGWLYCPGTVINYPVVQTNEHQFYLTHGFDDQPNTAGTLFADRDSVAGIVQSNYIIYGHNMKDNSMFGTFQHYVDEEYYRQNPTMYYLTPNGSYRVDLIGCHIVEGTTDNFPTYFGSTSEYQSYLDRIGGSFYWINRDAINTDYQLMTLSTCTSAAGYNDARLLVHGVMVPIE